MIKYGDLVQYIKDNHINWNTDLFDVLRGFFEQYSPPSQSAQSPFEATLLEEVLPLPSSFEEPPDGEYSQQDLLSLLNS